RRPWRPCLQGPRALRRGGSCRTSVSPYSAGTGPCLHSATCGRALPMGLRRRRERMAPMFATLHTTAGDIRIELFPNHAPTTVANFTGLATGTKTWTHPATGAESNDPLY